jgi:hypothetical protein
VNYAKVDAALAGALESTSDYEARTLPVFIHVDASAADRQILADLGVTGADAGQETVAATALSPQNVAQLSQQSWVRQLRLSRSLHLLEDQ